MLKFFSNFDLIFFSSGLFNSIYDTQIANYIVNQYYTKQNAITEIQSVMLKIIRALIVEAQKDSPFVSEEAFGYLTYWYICEKSKIKENEGNKKIFTKVFSALKISKCLACIKFQDRVHISELKEAFRLLKIKNNFLTNSITSDIYKKTKIIGNRIYKIITTLFIKSNKHIIDIEEVEKKILSEGFKRQDLVKCIGFYEEINQITISISKGKFSIYI